jgi:hypothetical protein
MPLGERAQRNTASCWCAQRNTQLGHEPDHRLDAVEANERPHPRDMCPVCHAWHLGPEAAQSDQISGSAITRTGGRQARPAATRSALPPANARGGRANLRPDRARRFESGSGCQETLSTALPDEIGAPTGLAPDAVTSSSCDRTGLPSLDTHPPRYWFGPLHPPVGRADLSVRGKGRGLERETGLEPATSTLGRWHSAS